MISLSCKNRKFNHDVALTRSKSESNRALILKSLFEDQLEIVHLSNAQDTMVLQEALNSYANVAEINVGHAGTAYRFLTAFLSIQPRGEWVLTGSERMKERPISVLVTALRKLGADISYVDQEGYPPLKIKGGGQLKNEVTLSADVSSQYISALLLIGSKILGGLKVTLEGKITSQPYLEMTLSMLKELGIEVKVDWVEKVIEISETRRLLNHHVEIEGDWSAASYWFGLVAMAEIGSSVCIKGLNETSRQGDAQLRFFYEQLGVSAQYSNEGWQVVKTGLPNKELLTLDLAGTPDVAQTIICSCAGLGIGVKLVGLHTLKIKETDRLEALQHELRKFGIQSFYSEDGTFEMKSGQELQSPQEVIATYDDHRMAMSFATLAMKTDLRIADEDVVEKSYPAFWKDLAGIINEES